jgi:hypothetical protein
MRRNLRHIYLSLPAPVFLLAVSETLLIKETPMKKILSLALAFTVSTLGLLSLLAQPVRAQQVASVGKSISEMKEEYERFLAVDRDPSTPAEVKEINHQLLETRRTQLRAAIESRLGALKKYQSSLSGTLSAEESLVIVNSIQALERDLSALTGVTKAPAATAATAPRARLINASASPETRASSDDAPVESAPKAAPEPKTVPRYDDPIVITSPADGASISVGEIELAITLNDPNIDDVMVAVFATGDDKPFGAREVEVRPSYRGKIPPNKVPISLRKGENRIEVTSSAAPAAKAVIKVTYKPGAAIGATAQNNANALASDPTAQALVEGTKEYDWGRVRGYFSGGVVFSKQRDDFSKSDFFVSFVLDKNYIRSRRYNVNTFFEARLSAIPVAAQPNASPTPTPSGTPDQLDTFITSRKAAMAQAGVYIPVNVTHWRHDRRMNTLFIGPVAKGGIQTITENRQTAEAKVFGADDVFNFFSIGARFGHYRYPRPAKQCTDADYKKYLTDRKTSEEAREDARDVFEGKTKPATRPHSWDGWDYDNARDCDEPWDYAPELISWLDITTGRWESFEVLLPTGFNDRSGNPITVRRRPWRYQAEGRLKVPGTPFIVGFDGNFGDGPDDVRFGFGMRFDVGKIIQKLKLIDTLSAEEEKKQDAKKSAGGTTP